MQILEEAHPHPMVEIVAIGFMLDKMKNTKSNDEFFSSMKR